MQQPSIRVLKSTEVEFASKKNIDPNGVLFYWENNVYRAISPNISDTYRGILKSDYINSLFDIGLVETELAQISFENYDTVLKHKKLSTVSYPTEWCGEMLKDAALLLLDLSLVLHKNGLELQDAHPWNVLFEGTKPIFIDFGSIVPIKNKNLWRPLKEFIGMFYNPLILMSFGLHKKARSLYINKKTNRGKRISKNEIYSALLSNFKLKEIFNGIPKLNLDSSLSYANQLEQLRDAVAKIKIPILKTAWSEYCDEEVDLATVKNWIPKRKTVYESLIKIKPKKLLDIGSNTGWFSKLAATIGSQVVSFDVDESSINKLYLNKEARKLNIIPLVMNFTNPTPAYGIELRCKPATERYKSDMVLALAIVHHLVFKQNVDFNFIIKNLSAYTKKWLLVEFIPREDKYVAKWNDKRFPWYTKNNFERELKKFFSKVEELPSNPIPRVMFLCEL